MFTLKAKRECIVASVPSTLCYYLTSVSMQLMLVGWLVKWRIIGSVQCWISSSSTYNKRARGIQLGLEFSTLVVCWNYLENSFKKWRPKLHFYRLILLLVKTRICWYKVYKGDFNVWPGLRIIVFEKSGLYFWRRGYIAQPWRVHFSRYWN